MKIKRLLAGIVACAMAVSAMAFTVSAEDNSYGDMNDDGQFEFSDYSIFTNPNIEIKVTYNNPESEAGWGNLGFGFSIDGVWKDITYSTDGGENEFVIAATKVMEDIEGDDVSTIEYGKVETMNSATLISVEVYEADPPAEEPEGEEPEGEEPGEGEDDEDDDVARDPIVLDNLNYDFSDGNYELFFKDHMDLEDVFLIKNVIVELITPDSALNGTIGFTGGEDWITNDYNFDEAGTQVITVSYPLQNINKDMLDGVTNDDGEEEDWNPGLQVQKWWQDNEEDALILDSITIEFYAPSEVPTFDEEEEDPTDDDKTDGEEEDEDDDTKTPDAKNPTTGAGGIVAVVGMSALALTAVTVSRKRK